MSLIEEALKRQARAGAPPAPPVVRPLDPPPAVPAPPAVRSRRQPPRRAAPRPAALLPGMALATGLVLLLLTATVVVWRELQRRTPADAAADPAALVATSGSAVVAAVAAMTDEPSAPSPAPMPIADAEPTAVAPAPMTPAGEIAAPSGPAVAMPDIAPTNPPAADTAWPLFTVKGFAVGDNSLAMLSNGEMLGEGEMSKTGARVLRVTPRGVWFVWRGQTNLLRKGESSDKPLDAEGLR